MIREILWKLGSARKIDDCNVDLNASNPRSDAVLGNSSIHYL
jgi:hypothetical protein